MSRPPKTKDMSVRAVGRAIAILQAINRAGALTMRDIAHESVLPYPTAYRIVRTLSQEGLIEREAGKKTYRPTALVLSLSSGFQGHTWLALIARRHAVELTEKVGWPISITTPVGDRMVIRESTHALTPMTYNLYDPGYALPMLESASGRAWIAFSPPDSRSSLLRTLRANPENAYNETLHSFESGQLTAKIKRDGYARKGQNKLTKNPGKTSSIAVPIFENGTICAALALAYFSSTMTTYGAARKYLSEMRRTVDAIVKELADSVSLAPGQPSPAP